MKRRQSSFNDISAKLVEYLIVRRSLTQNEIAEIIETDKSFVSRVRSSEREFSPGQMDRIAERLGVPMGVMLLDALRPKTPPTGEKKKILDLCERLMRQADEVTASTRAKKAS